MGLRCRTFFQFGGFHFRINSSGVNWLTPRT
jgi:hypothetical protein